MTRMEREQILDAIEGLIKKEKELAERFIELNPYYAKERNTELAIQTFSLRDAWNEVATLTKKMLTD